MDAEKRSLVWEVVLLLVTTVAAVGAPARIILGDRAVPGWVEFDYLVTCAFVADLLLRLLQARRSISAYGIRWFVVDGLAALPFALLPGGSALVVLRLLKLARVVQMMRAWWRDYASLWNTLRLVYSGYWIILIVHWLSSGWVALRGLEQAATPWDAYLRGLYWCVVTVATVGYGDITPRTNAEIVYAIVVMIVGVGLYGYVIGNVAHILSNLHPSRVRYVENMERLNGFLTYRDVPELLQNRIRDYYTYVWEKRLGFEESSIMSTLPPGLLTELSLFLKRDVIETVPFLKGASELLIKEIALAMRPVVYAPGDYIFRAGEQGKEMFFIGRGSVHVMAKDERTVAAELTDGAFFGEFALVLGQPRNASVRSVSYCDLYSLDKETFDRIIARHPEFAAHIASMMHERRPGQAPPDSTDTRSPS
jgi:hypothetical protein